MWRTAERNLGLSTEEIELSKGVRQANRAMDASDSRSQVNAQYGRILPEASQKILDEILQVNASNGDVVVDIGSGLGNFVLQAAIVCQCEARGIEVVNTRYLLSKFSYDEDLKWQNEMLHRKRDNIDYSMGKTEFVHGKLEDPQHQDFLTKPSTPGGSIKAFCNNYGGVFAHKSAKDSQLYVLDDYIAGLFALMPPGSILVTLHPLTLALTRSQANAQRETHGLERSTNASYYEMEKIDVGPKKEVVSWGRSDNPLYAYKYTRVHQDTTSAVFQCSNPNCSVARAGTNIAATRTRTIGEEQLVVRNICECNVDGKSRRPGIRTVNYKEVAGNAAF